MIPDGAGVPALMTLARNGSETVRKGAVFWLGQRDEEAPRALVRTVAGDEKETEAVRRAAIFALSQGEGASSADFAFLRSLFDRVTSERLKDQVLFSVSQREEWDGTRWLLEKARDESQPMEVRRKAVFWAGQGHASVAEIVGALQEREGAAVARAHHLRALAARTKTRRRRSSCRSRATTPTARCGRRRCSGSRRRTTRASRSSSPTW